MISHRLQELRKELGHTKRELLKILPLNYSTYANYESGMREPNSETLQTIAKFYNVSIDYLMGLTDNRKRVEDVMPLTDAEYDHIKSYRRLDSHGKNLVDFILQSESNRVRSRGYLVMQESAKKKNYVSLQVFNQKASAGFGNYLDDDSDSDYEVIRFEPDAISEEADFGVRLMGYSMEPKYKDNDIVCVKNTPHLDDGQIGIFIYEGEAYCKKLKIDRRKGRVILESLNVRYEPKLIDQPSQLKTVGLVLGVGITKDI